MTDQDDRRARLERETQEAMRRYLETYEALLIALRDIADWRRDCAIYPDSPHLAKRGLHLRGRLRDIQNEARRAYVHQLRTKADLVEYYYNTETTEIPDFLPEEL